MKLNRFQIAQLSLKAPNNVWSRTTWFTLILWLLLLAGIGLGTKLMLESTLESRRSNLERNMIAQSQLSLTRLGVWFGNLKTTLNNFVSADMLRTFIYESSSSKGSDLKSQTQFIQTQLIKFNRDNDFLSTSIYLNPKSPLLTTSIPNNISTFEASITHVFDTGLSLMLPVHLDAKQNQVIDFILPIFPPTYIEEDIKKCTAVLVVTLDVSSKIAGTTGASGDFLRIASFLDNALYSMPTTDAPALPLGDTWKVANKNTPMPLALRELPFPKGGVEPVYACALPVPDLPWFVIQAMPTKLFENNYKDVHQSIIFAAYLLAILITMGISILWWWFIKRNERQATNEMRHLYKTLNHQKQLLEGINASIEEGIVLCDTAGRITYANEAFARMSGEKTTSLLHKNCFSLLEIDVAQSLNNKWQKLLNEKKSFHGLETLRICGLTKSYKYTCTPFNSNSNEISMVLVYGDITELEALQASKNFILGKTVQAFLRALEVADGYLFGKSKNISILSQAIAKDLKFQNETILITSAQLSQLGMLRVPHELMAKNDAFTPEERAQMEKHVDYILEIIGEIDFGMPVQQAISHMYERLDGSGYPKKLTAPDICLEGRILAVAYDFCSMLRPRSYRKKLSFEQAIEIFHKNSSKYDPTVLESLWKFLESEAGKLFVKNLTQKTSDS